MNSDGYHSGDPTADGQTKGAMNSGVQCRVCRFQVWRIRAGKIQSARAEGDPTQAGQSSGLLERAGLYEGDPTALGQNLGGSKMASVNRAGESLAGMMLAGRNRSCQSWNRSGWACCVRAVNGRHGDRMS